MRRSANPTLRKIHLSLPDNLGEYIKIEPRRTNAMSQGVSRSLIIFGVVLVGGFEFIRAFPDVLLLPQRLAGQTGEYQGKALQGDLIAAQTAKTLAEAQLARTQAELARTQEQLNQNQAGLFQSQTNNTNLDSLNKGIGLAATAALIYGGMKVYEAATSGDNGQQSGASQNSQQRAQAPQSGPQRYATAQSTPQQDAKPQSSSPRYAFVTALKLNLRSGPGATYQSLSTLPQGARVTVVREAENGWLEIDAFGEAGAPVHGFANSTLLSTAQ
jgi:hypothetical protein